ncbi:polysaccharide pyruvyl transferase family protein [Acetobacterium wieringae]|uniref:Putative pyruvyl transferase EpsI n=1 Tax=Acetobacterium wieringae TaxID=52694 RepID=A0A1F2PJ45_9FIRM|nr:polysaccharide pyruvyl transferase family protein [Acetobacterium wieringae]OFV71347.1 putative pyruvyl transferase EpsI [Acetobacterium wieringae]
MLIKIKKILKPLLKPSINRLQKLQFEFFFKNTTKEIRRKHGYCLILMATPCHGNLGDHAIVQAQYNLLSDVGLRDLIIEINNSNYEKYKDIIRKYTSSDDIIIIDGGGNLGTLWPHEDDKISEIINLFRFNKTVVFPQTCYYSNDSDGEKRLQKNKTIYSEHANLTICLRDKQSFDFAQRNFSSTKFIFVPDIVLYIDKVGRGSVRDGVLLCFRKDLEKVAADENINRIKDFIRNHNIKYDETDTVINKNVSKRTRDEELRKKWDQFSKSGLVITDRLHGMIFAAITGTPCIAIDNKSKKVSGVYEWISKLKNIKVCDDMSKIDNTILDLYKSNFEYDKSFLNDHFAEICSVFTSVNNNENS